MKHTRGSWRPIVCSIQSGDHSVLTEIRIESSDHVIANLSIGDVPDKQAIANAKLLAAAPDLLFWLQVARDVLSKEFVASLVTPEKAIEGINAVLQKMGVESEITNS